MLRKVVGVTTLVGFTAGCSSAYIPQPGPRVSIVMENGSLAYVRDGKTYEGGLFGGEIEEAVKGDARAEEYAHEYKSGLITGFALSMLGVGAAVGGAVVAVSEESRGGGEVPVAGLGLLGVGAVLDLVGSFIIMGAVPHLYDAVNAYNDSLGRSADTPAGSASVTAR